MKLTQPREDTDTLVYVMADDKIPDDSQPDNDSYPGTPFMGPPSSPRTLARASTATA